MEKYYTPTIEEFYVGFEYESKVTHFRTGKVTWYRCAVENDFASCIYQNLIDNSQIRVKYLDQEDIESLGFKKSSICDFGDADLWLIEMQSQEEPIVIYFFGRVKFEGVVKNKSELKRLLVQLGALE